MNGNLHRPSTADSPGNRTFAEVLSARLTRRGLLGGALAGTLLAGLPGCAMLSGGKAPRLTFTPVPPSTADALRFPPEYQAMVLLAWGEPVGAAPRSPGFRFDASNTAADQALQVLKQLGVVPFAQKFQVGAAVT